MSVDPAASQPRLEFRAAMLVVAVLLLIAVSAGYLLYARGVFERTQTLVLIADDSEGVAVRAGHHCAQAYRRHCGALPRGER